MNPLRTLLNRLIALPVNGDDGARWSLSLIVRLRFVHVLFELALLYPALQYGWMYASDIPWYLGALIGLLTFNVLTGAWQRRGFDVSPTFLLLQIAVDLTAMTVLFGVSGGLTSPVHTLVHFQVGLAGLLLPTIPALAALALGLVALTLLGWGTQNLANAYAWVGPLGSNLAYEWALAAAVAGLSIFAAHLNRHYRERLRDAEAKLRQQDRLRAAGAVASGFCHELASPLNAATLLTNRLRRKTAPGQAPVDLTEEWEELDESLARCERIVKNMAGTPWDPQELGLQTVDAGLLLQKIAQEWSGRSRLNFGKGVTPGQFAAAPAVGLAQCVMNLLRNADEASPPGATIDLQLEDVRVDGRGLLRILVADRGTGINAETLRALGEPFNSTKGAGRGLGLFAARHLTESLGGSLTLAPRGGGGTEALLTLPRPSIVDDTEDRDELVDHTS